MVRVPARSCLLWLSGFMILIYSDTHHYKCGVEGRPDTNNKDTHYREIFFFVLVMMYKQILLHFFIHYFDKHMLLNVFIHYCDNGNSFLTTQLA